jgi:hypothetical protein
MIFLDLTFMDERKKWKWYCKTKFHDWLALFNKAYSMTDVQDIKNNVSILIG